jgi:hypothetical protein
MKIFYLRDGNKRPIVTVASEENVLHPGVVEFTIATCHPNDKPVKKIGRDIVCGRMAAGKSTWISLDGNNTERDLILNAIATNFKASPTASRLAGDYLYHS